MSGVLVPRLRCDEVVLGEGDHAFTCGAELFGAAGQSVEALRHFRRRNGGFDPCQSLSRPYDPALETAWTFDKETGRDLCPLHSPPRDPVTRR